MTENQELKSVSGDTTDQKPEDLEVTNIPGVEEKLKDKLEDANVPSVKGADLPKMPKDRVDKLATPYRAVLWRKYEDLKVLFDEFWNAHEEALVANLRIKGRKSKGGKVTGARKMAENQVPISKLYRPVISELLKESIDGDVLYFDAMEVFDYAPGKTAQILGVFFFIPDLEFNGEINWGCPRPPMPPLADQLNMRYKELQRQYRTLEDDPDGVITKESSIKVDITATLEGEPYTNGTVHQQWIDVGGIPSDELIDQLLGHKVGDLFECNYAVTRHDQKNAGKPLQATVKIHGLQRIITPEVSDDLAKAAGFSDLSEFKKRFSSDYTKYLENAMKSAAVDHVISQITRGSKVPEVPQEWVEVQLEHRLQDAIKASGGDKKRVMQSYMARDEDELKNRIRGHIYTDVMQQCAVQWYLKEHGVDKGNEAAFYDSILDKIEWVDRDDK